MEFDDFDFEKIDKEAQQQCLAKYVGKWIKCSMKDYDGEWDVDIVHVVGVAEIREDDTCKTALVFKDMHGFMDCIPVEKIEERTNPGKIYYTVLDDEMAKSELDNL